MSLVYPPTVIVRHPRENPRKCSVLPLRGRPDLMFLPYPVRQRPPLDGYVRLSADGPPLTAADAASGLLLLDGSWRWAASMTRNFADVPPRSLSGWRTAYPRIVKAGHGPRQRPGVGGGAVRGVPHPGPADGGTARSLSLGGGVSADE